MYCATSLSWLNLRVARDAIDKREARGIRLRYARIYIIYNYTKYKLEIAEKGQKFSIAIFHFRMEVCNGSHARMEVCNGSHARMEARNGIFFTGPSSYSVRKRERDTRAYIASLT